MRRSSIVASLLSIVVAIGLLSSVVAARPDLPEGRPAPKSPPNERVAPGITFREDSLTLDDGAPLEAQVLVVDSSRRKIDLLPVLANDRVVEKETVGSMDARYVAVAAINGGYFVVNGAYAGDPTGAYLLDGEVVSDGKDRTALLFCESRGSKERVEIGEVDFSGGVTSSDGSSRSIDVANGARGADQLVLFREIFGDSTLTDSSGVEVILDENGTVLNVEDGAGDAEIPENGSVLSGDGEAAGWLSQHAAVGETLEVEADLSPTEPGDECEAEYIVGAGPNLVTDGREDTTQENFGHEETRNPRTAFGVTESGKFLLVTVDGRSEESAGVTIDELAEYMVSLGAEEAMNLDGGGSSTMIVRNEVRNTPSDGQQRPVSDGIVVLNGKKAR